MGNEVRLPTLAENFIAVKDKDKVTVRLHEMRSLEIIRKLKISLDDNFFDNEENESECEESLEPESKSTPMGAKTAL